MSDWAQSEERIRIRGFQTTILAFAYLVLVVAIIVVAVMAYDEIQDVVEVVRRAFNRG